MFAVIALFLCGSCGLGLGTSEQRAGALDVYQKMYPSTTETDAEVVMFSDLGPCLMANVQSGDRNTIFTYEKSRDGYVLLRKSTDSDFFDFDIPDYELRSKCEPPG
ncbi:hypothetical protein [Aestuariimicrobium kwangyangense]|uniref:hypothetical protein n=1 Tax=Aestuariimicrobium kwangyangense TaxID=396389 RepID=UPI0003B62596|nr:hypothetical protein [Aestuariimicrobium kwangyangense]